MMKHTAPTDAKKLIVIGAVERLIDWYARRTHVESIGYDPDDLRQEGMLKVLRVINEYPDTPATDLIPLVKTSLNNLYSKLVRIRFLQRNTGITVDLTAAMDREGQSWMDETYIEHQVEHLCSMLDDDAQTVLRALVFPDPELMDAIVERTADEATASVPAKVMAELLGMSRKRYREALEKVEAVASTVLVPQTA